MMPDNPRAVIGGNNPPDPLDAINAAHEAVISEAPNWLDGAPVETEAQMQAVDDLRKAARAWRMDLEAGQKSESAPLHDAWQAALARWKPTINDAQRIEKGLVAAVDGFKRKLAEQKAEAERKARAEAEAARRAAERAARAAAESDLEAQREAARLMVEAAAATAAAKAASTDTVKGMRTVTRYEVTDERALLHWIARNDRAAISAFIQEYARRNHGSLLGADGLTVWTEKVAA